MLNSRKALLALNPLSKKYPDNYLTKYAIGNYYNIDKIRKVKIDVFTKRKATIKINSGDKSKLMIEHFCKEIFDSKYTCSMKEIIKQGIVMEASRISNLKEKTVFLRDLTK